MSARASIREHLAERVNPILVKEVRAALRGRFFRFSFPILVLGAVLIGMIALVDAGDSPAEHVGRSYFGSIYVCLCIAVLGVVPLSAFLSMGGEWDAHTYDLLVISDLKPRQIVLGKLASAALEGLLYASAFAPLLVFAFLLRGIDIVAVVLLLVSTAVGSLAATAVALALSSLSRLRVVRVLLLAVVAGGSVFVVVGAFAFAELLVMRRFGFRTGFDWEEILVVLTVVSSIGFLGLTIACERLAHPEENHSTGPRLLVTALLLVGIGIIAWAEIFQRSTPSPDLHVPIVILLVLAAGAQVFFVTESETLTRRVRLHVPRNPLAALACVPFLPGGGRGVILFFVHVAIALLAGILMHQVGAWRAADPASVPPFQVARVLGFAAYLFLYVAGFSILFARRSSEPRTRFLARIVVPCLACLSILAPALVGFLMQQQSWVELRHPLNPFWSVLRFGSSHAEPAGPVVFLVFALAFGAFLVNLPRMARGIDEVRAASHERRARAARAVDAAAREAARVAPGS